MSIIECIYQPPTTWAECHTKSIFKRSLTDFNISFPSPTLVVSPVCPTILTITGRRIEGWTPFPMLFMLCEMRTASSGIWTLVAVFIFYNDNRYTTSASITTHNSRQLNIYNFNTTGYYLHTCNIHPLLLHHCDLEFIFGQEVGGLRSLYINLYFWADVS